MRIIRFLALTVFLALWLIIAETELVKPIFLPPLPKIFSSLVAILLSEDGIKNILFTLLRAVTGFVIGSAIAIPLGIFLGVFKKIYESVEWLIDFFRSVPVSALFPLFLIFFGFGDLSKIAMGAWACGFVVLINSMHGVWNAKDNLKVMAMTKRATKLQILTKITLPQTLPFIFAGMRIGISWNLIVVVVAEMFIGTPYGIGHIIYDASMIFDTPSVLAGIIILGVIGLIINRIILMIERRIVHWKGM